MKTTPQVARADTRPLRSELSSEMKVLRPQMWVVIIISPSVLQQRFTQPVVLGLEGKGWVSGVATGTGAITCISPGSKVRAARLSPCTELPQEWV